MAWARAGIALGAVVLGALALSGGHRDDPRTPAGLPGLPPPFLGTAVIGAGGRTAAVDAYGDVVDLRAPGPAGRPLVAVSSKRQAVGTVSAGSTIVVRVRLGDGRTLPFWRADSVWQRYLPGSNALRTVADVGGERFALTQAIGSDGIGCRAKDKAWQGTERCSLTLGQLRSMVRADRHWLQRARGLGAGAPPWARAMYRRSLLVLRALTDRRSGAVAAGARDGWAYVWPRDAAAVAIALADAGYGPEARRISRFLIGLDLNAAARFSGTGAPVPGRAAQGDAAGWIAVAARAAGLQRDLPIDTQWRGRADYQEGDSGDYLANTIASTADGPKTHPYRGKSARRRRGDGVASAFETPRGLVRIAGAPDSGLDSAAAWAVRPFPLPALFPAARRTLLRLVAEREGRYGLVPSENWTGGDDPWTAPTAWTAWSLAALARSARRSGASRVARADRRAALSLMADLRRAATPLGLLPERVDAHTGLPTSTTPLAWSHAFAILALRTMWRSPRPSR